jgi:hypothetical protein
MAKTAQGLADYAVKANQAGWGYCLGTFGNTLNTALLSQKCAQGGGVGTYNTKHKSYLQGFIGKRVSDCYGLVKGYLWTEGNGEPAYNAAQDRNQEGAYNAAKEKGPLSTIPNIPGIVLWMKGHAGIYLGNGKFIECAGVPVGCRQGTISNGVVTSGSKFTNWFKDTFIDYTQTQATTPNAVNVSLPKATVNVPATYQNGTWLLSVNGQQIPIRAIIEAMGLNLVWAVADQTIVVTV